MQFDLILKLKNYVVFSSWSCKTCTIQILSCCKSKWHSPEKMRKGSNQCRSVFCESLPTGDETRAGPSGMDDTGMAGRRQAWDKEARIRVTFMRTVERYIDKWILITGCESGWRDCI